MRIVGTSHCAKDVLECGYRSLILSLSSASGARQSVPVDGIQDVTDWGEDRQYNVQSKIQSIVIIMMVVFNSSQYLLAMCFGILFSSSW